MRENIIKIKRRHGWGLNASSLTAIPWAAMTRNNNGGNASRATANRRES